VFIGLVTAGRGCLVPGLAKVLGQPRMPKAAAHFGIPWTGYRVIGVADQRIAERASNGASR